MYTNMSKPSENMLRSQHEINAMTREHMEGIYKAEKDKALMESSAYERDAKKYKDTIHEYTTSRDIAINKRNKFLHSVKEGFLSAALMKIYTESMNSPINDRDEIIMKNLVSKFVQEQGVGDLLTRFDYQNTLLAEIGRVVQESYDKVVSSISSPYTDSKKDMENLTNKTAEEAKKAEKYDLKLDQTIVDDFYKDMVDIDTLEASKLIKDKVAEAIEEFIDSNVEAKVDYETIINKAKEKTEKAHEESTIEIINNEAKRQIHEAKRTRHKNIFHYVVENITKEVFKDANLKARYVHESAVDMDGIVHSAEIIYTMLEMVNTLEIVDTQYIKNYISAIID